MIICAVVGVAVGMRLGALQKRRRAVFIALGGLAWIAVSQILLLILPRSDLGLIFILPLLNLAVAMCLIAGGLGYVAMRFFKTH